MKRRGALERPEARRRRNGRPLASDDDRPQESKRPPRSSNGKKRHAGVYFYPYALELFRERRITFRGALLLAVLDHYVNPFGDRRRRELLQRDPLSLDENLDCMPKAEPVERFDTTTGKLRELLRCNSMTVRNTINRLTSLRPRVLWAESVNRRWEMSTVPDRETPKDDFAYVPPRVFSLWLDGRLDSVPGWSMLLMAIVDSFARKYGTCYASNAWLGRQCGVKKDAAKDMVSRLVGEKMIKATCKTRGRRIIRYLAVPDAFDEQSEEIPDQKVDGPHSDQDDRRETWAGDPCDDDDWWNVWVKERRANSDPHPDRRRANSDPHPSREELISTPGEG
jgi:hypothetical protein